MGSKPPINVPEKYTRLKDSLETGHLKIPKFQRDFVWSMQKSADLLDSILKQFPIGTFIFWSTDESLRAVKDIGSIPFKERPEKEKIDYVLDGQQRLTSIYAVLEGRKIDKIDYSKIFVDLAASEDQQIVVTDTDKTDSDRYISVCELFSIGLKDGRKYPDKYIDKLDHYRDILSSLEFPVIKIEGVSIDIASEVFTRINKSGKELSLFEIMVAKTYDESKNFDLEDRWKELSNALQEVGYDTVSPIIILQLISILLTADRSSDSLPRCDGKQIFSLDKDEIINIWDEAVYAMKQSIDYFRNYYRVPASRLLPYNALIIPFAYYFHKHNKFPSGEHEKKLRDFFWRVSLGDRYSTSAPARIAQDIPKVSQILKNKPVSYEWNIDYKAEYIINNGSFSVNRSFIKAILAIMASKSPKSFHNNADINIYNDWLHRANSKNYHHFFPKAVVKNDERVNNIVNITIVDDFLNKKQIKAKRPSVYMKEFSNENPDIKSTMKTHLIDIDRFGIYEDNFDLFIKQRAELLSNEIKERIIESQVDN